MFGTILSGTISLVRNSAFPAAFVTIGHLPLIEDKLPRISLDNLKGIQLTALPGTVIELAKNNLAKNFSLSDIKNNFSYVPKLFYQINIKELHEAFSKHQLTIRTAAAIGASATILDALFKRLPLIKDHPYLRGATSIGLASTLILYGMNFLNLKVDPQIIMDIAIKVGLIGFITHQTTTLTSDISFILSKKFKDSRIGYVCNGISLCADALNWGGPPTLSKTMRPLEGLTRGLASSAIELDNVRIALQGFREELNRQRRN